MKKTLAVFLTVALLLSILTTIAYAAGRGCERRYANVNMDRPCDQKQCAGGFIDEDGNGICDHREAVTEDLPEGRFYVDADNNGVCDNYAQNAPRRNGFGCGQGCCRGRGR